MILSVEQERPGVRDKYIAAEWFHTLTYVICGCEGDKVLIRYP